MNEVRNIKDAIASKLLAQQLDPLESDKSFCGTLMSEFQPVTVTEVERLIRLMPSKSSPLDAFPTSLIKQCSSTFAPVISRLANLSFEHATFPSNFKTAQVTPLLKKHGLDASDPANYRPISNLNTISKILERLVLTRIVGHVSLSPNFDVFQSAYKRHHSTETALLKLTDDIFARFDDRQSTILVALDQSAAFDCIDHTTLIRRLHHSFGVTGITLSWIKSYLESRSMYVRMKQVSSSVQPLETGVPQGSVLGPLLFCLYISPLSRVIRAHGINYHQYTDDTQVYIAVSNSDFQVKLNQLETCTASIHSWLQMNGLQLNPNKSEVIQFTAARGRNRVEDVTSIQISNAAIKPSSTIKSLGVTLDTKLSFDEHVTNVCRLCYCHIRALRHVRASLPNDVARTVACSIIGSRLDYCNSLLAGTTKSNLVKFQRVQNTLARVTVQQGKFDRITPVLKQLHWLPIEQRITFKLATLSYNIKSTGQPAYLRELLSDYQPVRTLRSSSKHLLTVNVADTVLATRGFRHSAVAVWNSLPDSIRDSSNIDIFKRKVKTLLFNAAFVA